MAFFTIFVAPDLSPPDHRKAVRAGPIAVGTRSDHHTMLQSAGFETVEETDVTLEFLRTQRAWVNETLSRSEELKKMQDTGAFEDRQRDRRLCAAAVERGLLRRALFVARRQ